MCTVRACTDTCFGEVGDGGNQDARQSWVSEEGGRRVLHGGVERTVGVVGVRIKMEGGSGLQLRRGWGTGGLHALTWG